MVWDQSEISEDNGGWFRKGCFWSIRSRCFELYRGWERHHRWDVGLCKAGYGEIFFSDVDDDDKWYKAKLQFITIDEKSEKEKRSNVTYLVQAKSLARALRYIDEVMGKTMIDYDVVGLNETKLMDVFEHHAPNEKKEEKNDVPEYEEK